MSAAPNYHKYHLEKQLADPIAIVIQKKNKNSFYKNTSSVFICNNKALNNKEKVSGQPINNKAMYERSLLFMVIL